MKYFLAISLMTLSMNTYADRFTLTPQCYKPNEPLTYSTDYYINRYNDDIIEFKQCI